ncbi:transposase [Streptomyces sp. NPDC101151]|uniref:transposase n=1 Tax=Streptomyces sp. NPDC101151 TaxID=3366115 RepID=UPI00382CA640
MAIAEATAAHPYTPLFATMPRIGKVSLGQVIGAIGPILERAQTCEQLIAQGGVVPVTRASGKSRTVAFRFAANRRARVALTTLPTIAGTAATGPPRSTTTPGPARRHIRTPSASWPAPGCG